MSPGDFYVIPDDETGGEETWIQPRSVDEIVIDAILEATDIDPDDLDPLGEYVDYDALKTLFEDEEDATISFEVEDYEVTVHHSGTVDVVETQ